jgi:nuclear pore complex protein Nup107
MECMELAAQIADKEGHVAKLFVDAGRMKELLEAFASASKALAIWTGEKKASAQSNTKRNRELGWSRELWSVRP